jgi:hypothetical protein
MSDLTITELTERMETIKMMLNKLDEIQAIVIKSEQRKKKMNENSKKYYDEHKNDILNKQKDYYIKNQNYKKELARCNYYKNRDKILETQKAKRDAKKLTNVSNNNNQNITIQRDDEGGQTSQS